MNELILREDKNIFAKLCFKNGEKMKKNIAIKVVFDWLAGETWEIITLVLKILTDIVSGRIIKFFI